MKIADGLLDNATCLSLTGDTSADVSRSDGRCPTAPSFVDIAPPAARLTFAALMLAFAATWTGASSVFARPLNHVHVVNQASGSEHGGAQHDQQVGVVVALGMRDA